MIFCINLRGDHAIRVDRSERRRFWETHIEKWNSSELFQAEYCRQSGINIKSFHHWKRRAGQLCCKPVLVELPFSKILPSSNSSLHPQLCIVSERFRIEIGRGFDFGDLELYTLLSLRCPILRWGGETELRGHASEAGRTITVTSFPILLVR